ncbi:putative tricarboxylic transport membrane protein [Pseudonocardia ammonioxydans]|uniref:Putative tricarboxylic transport membrane protein n=1 Tax=Pseudonocardia ammonioxydans TaxID=260086 RepID=A0A1I4YC74_PSUAM|nr:tripartite tricarboxylate transporter permease [Pseudonocardia ammonioxydans]SFN35647.1 putative tricarboxylic transport membrane protein [Pseudonocardia ammonioxydans]
MGVLDSIVFGFSVALTPANLLYVFAGVLLGTVVGVLPGLGPTAAIALLLPLTYTVEPTSAIILLAGIYYGSMYGGTITSVLLRLPGEAASVVTTFDGYEMARQGRAGPALSIAAIGSFVGATVALVGLTLLARPLAEFAVGFGPAEYTALAVLGILLVAYLGTGSFSRALVMAAGGLLLATVGQDPITGAARFSFGSLDLLGGLDLVSVAMGLFGVGELLHNVANRHGAAPLARVGRLLPDRADAKRSIAPVARGSVLGFLVGALPGGGGLMGSLASYAVEKKVAPEPERFGRGAIEGVAGPETANNASSTSAFIPLLTLGLPSNSVLALLFGALLLQGVTPGPLLATENPEIFWGVIASMYIGNVMLLALNLPLVGVFIRLLRVRIGVLSSVAVLLTLIGVYSIGNSTFDMGAVLAFGVLGFLLKQAGFEPGPLVLAFVLGSLLESSFRQALLLSNGSFGIFVLRPVSAVLLGVTVVLLAVAAVRAWRSRVSGRRNPESTTEGVG